MDDIARYYSDLRIPLTRRGGLTPYIQAMKPIMNGTIAVVRRLFEEAMSREPDLPDGFDQNDEILSIAQQWSNGGLYSLSPVRERLKNLRYHVYWAFHELGAHNENSVKEHANNNGRIVAMMNIEIIDAMENIFLIPDYQKSVDKRLKETYAMMPRFLGRHIPSSAAWLTALYYTDGHYEPAKAIVANTLLEYPRID